MKTPKSLIKACCLIAALALLCGLSYTLCPPAAAISSVDLSRVKFSKGSENMEFKFGGVTIPGVATQYIPFTEEEINKIVQDTLKEKGLTQLAFTELTQTVERARRAATFTKEDMMRIKDNLMTSLGTAASVTPVDAVGEVSTVLTWIDKYMNSKSWDDIGTVSVNMMENAMSDKVKETAKGFFNDQGELGEDIVKDYAWVDRINNIISFAAMLEDENARTEQKWKDIADGANAKRTLNEFYDILQTRIDAYKEKSDAKGWYIKFNQEPGRRSFTFFGVDSNMQIWTLDMTLQQKTGESGSIAGTYTGPYAMRVTHIMEEGGFTTRAHEAVLHMDKPMKYINKYLNDPNLETKLITTPGGKATIERMIYGHCEAVIDESGKISMTLTQETDNTNVSFSNIEVVMQVSNRQGPKLNFDFPFEICDVKNTESAVVKWKSVNIYDSAPDVNVKGDYAMQGAVFNVGWDKEIWKPWEGTEKTLVFSDRS
jgi:hypothetical protein